MNDFFVRLEQLNVTIAGKKVLQDISFTLQHNQQWAVTGPSGSGKTVLAETLVGRHFYTGAITTSFGTAETFHRHILVVEQQHRFHDLTNRSDFYYQQRFNASDAEQTLTVAQELAGYEAANKNKLIEQLHLQPLLDEPLIQLSNGENKRLQLAKALLQHPAMLVLDNPFIGLDVEGRKLLHTILNRLNKEGMHMLLITSAHELPGYITHIASLQNGNLTSTTTHEQFKPAAVTAKPLFTGEQLKKILSSNHTDFTTAVRMVDVHVQYGDKKILQHINWEIKKGERWSVSGPNGAGKSTLLSLITADNPQAYANEIYLFDRRRGSGESIWDIKKKIGYVSPELHLYFEYSVTCFQAIASGLFDTIGLFRAVNDEQEAQVLQWMELLQLRSKQHTLLRNLSAGEQRLILLARALVKNPPLLVLDEPCQGLDEEQQGSFKQILETLGAHFQTTLIYVSHYREEIPSIVTRHLELKNGTASIT
jgi:molybdate transport system ATP-binding protein